MNKFILSFIRNQIGLVKNVLRNMINFIDYDVNSLSKYEEVSNSTPVIVNQVVSKRRKYRQMRYANDGFVL